ncbi:hypothetical protein [Mycobacteroides abscessus]|uniref:hypothetical protein n=1 Tax=Mycobacteroides abscessus TaxID=36809 RepID=UPI0005B34367|nr:hypothetical protein [Mycobacteroides abscessus]
MAGERELSEEPAGEIYIDEYYELRASNGLMQIVPSTFSVAPPVDDPESAVRQFIDDVHRMAAEMASCAGVSDPMVIIRRYDSPMDQLLAVGDDHASRFRLPPRQGLTMDAARTEERRRSWQQRLRRLFRSGSG